MYVNFGIGAGDLETEARSLRSFGRDESAGRMDVGALDGRSSRSPSPEGTQILPPGALRGSLLKTDKGDAAKRKKQVRARGWRGPDKGDAAKRKPREVGPLW